MTAATLLDMMEVVDNSLETGSGETDETRSLLALNMAQDHLEARIALKPKLLQAIGTLATVADTETTALPAGLLRLDTLWLLNASSQQVRELRIIRETGGHTPSSRWPFGLLGAIAGNGAPVQAYVTTTTAFWQPTPDAAHTVRYYGFVRAADLATRSSTVEYDDLFALPLASFAALLLRVGLDHPGSDLSALAETAFDSALEALRRLDRSRPHAPVYTMVHDT